VSLFPLLLSHPTLLGVGMPFLIVFPVAHVFLAPTDVLPEPLSALSSTSDPASPIMPSLLKEMDSDYDTSVDDDIAEVADSASDVIPQSSEQLAHLRDHACMGKPSRDSFSSLPTFILTDAMMECLVFRTGKQFYTFKEVFLLKKSFGDIFCFTQQFPHELHSFTMPSTLFRTESPDSRSLVAIFPLWLSP
jgi:hypothetical protein